MFICVRFTYDQYAFGIERDFFFTPIRSAVHDSWKAGIPYLTWWIIRSVNWRFIQLATSDFNFVAIFFHYYNSFSRKDTKARFCLPLKVISPRQMGFSEIVGLDCTTKTQSRSILSAISPLHIFLTKSNLFWLRCGELVVGGGNYNEGRPSQDHKSVSVEIMLGRL